MPLRSIFGGRTSPAGVAGATVGIPSVAETMAEIFVPSAGPNLVGAWLLRNKRKTALAGKVPPNAPCSPRESHVDKHRKAIRSRSAGRMIRAIRPRGAHFEYRPARRDRIWSAAGGGLVPEAASFQRRPRSRMPSLRVASLEAGLASGPASREAGLNRVRPRSRPASLQGASPEAGLAPGRLATLLEDTPIKASLAPASFEATSLEATLLEVTSFRGPPRPGLVRGLAPGRLARGGRARGDLALPLRRGPPHSRARGILARGRFVGCRRDRGRPARTQRARKHRARSDSTSSADAPVPDDIDRASAS